MTDFTNQSLPSVDLLTWMVWLQSDPPENTPVEAILVPSSAQWRVTPMPPSRTLCLKCWSSMVSHSQHSVDKTALLEAVKDGLMIVLNLCPPATSLGAAFHCPRCSVLTDPFRVTVSPIRRSRR